MGQQQLLLLILSALIISIAMIAGINRFVEGTRIGDEDEIRQALTTIAARAQGWYRRPRLLGGGGRSFSEITLTKINFKPGTISGNLSLSDLQQGSFRVTGTSVEDSTWSLTIIVYPDSIASVP